MGFMQSATGLGEKLMARRYRYAFAKKREASKGKWSVGLAAASLVLFIAAVVLALFFDGKLGGLIGGTGLFAILHMALHWGFPAFRKKTGNTGRAWSGLF